MPLYQEMQPPIYHTPYGDVKGVWSSHAGSWIDPTAKYGLAGMYWTAPIEKLYQKDYLEPIPTKTEYKFDRASATFKDQSGKELGKLIYNKEGKVVGYEDYQKQQSIQFKRPLPEKDALQELSKTQQKEMIEKAIATTPRGYITTVISPYTPPTLRESEVQRQILGIEKSPIQKAIESEAERRGIAYTPEGRIVSVQPAKVTPYLLTFPTSEKLKEQAEMERRYYVEMGKEAPLPIKVSVPTQTISLALSRLERGEKIPLKESYYEAVGRMWEKQRKIYEEPEKYIRQKSYLHGREGTLVGVDTRFGKSLKTVVGETAVGTTAFIGAVGLAIEPLALGLGAISPKITIPSIIGAREVGQVISIPLKTIPITTLAEAGIGTALITKSVVSIAKAPTLEQKYTELATLGLGVAGSVAGYKLARAFEPRAMSKAIEIAKPKTKTLYLTKAGIGETRRIMAELLPSGRIRMHVSEKPIIIETLTSKRYKPSIPIESVTYAKVMSLEKGKPLSAMIRSVEKYQPIKPPTLFEQRFGKLGLAPKIVDVRGLGSGKVGYVLGYGKPRVEFVDSRVLLKELSPLEYTRHLIKKGELIVKFVPQEAFYGRKRGWIIAGEYISKGTPIPPERSGRKDFFVTRKSRILLWEELRTNKQIQRTLAHELFHREQMPSKEALEQYMPSFYKKTGEWSPLKFWKTIEVPAYRFEKLYTKTGRTAFYKEPTEPTIFRTEVELYTKVAGKEPVSKLVIRPARPIKPFATMPKGKLFAELGIREIEAKPKPVKPYEITEPYADVGRITEVGDAKTWLKQAMRYKPEYESVAYPPETKFGIAPAIISSEPQQFFARAIRLGITKRPITAPFIITTPRQITRAELTQKTEIKQLQIQKMELINAQQVIKRITPEISTFTLSTPIQTTIQPPTQITIQKPKVVQTPQQPKPPYPTQPVLPKTTKPTTPVPPFLFFGQKPKKKIKKVKMTKFEKRLMAKVDVFPIPDPLSILQTEAKTLKKAKFLAPTPKVKKAFEKEITERPFIWRFPTAEIYKGRFKKKQEATIHGIGV